MTNSQVQVTFHGLERSEALEALILEKAEKLRLMHDRLQRIRVVIDMPHRSHSKGNQLEVKVECMLPGEDELVISRESELDAEHDSAFSLVREVFQAAQRVVRDQHKREETERRTAPHPTPSPAAE